MNRRIAQLVAQAAALVGFATSVWLVTQYALPPSLSVCGPGGGCHTIQMCRLSSVAGVSWPVIGTIAFAGLLALTLTSHPRARTLLAPAGALAAVTGVALLALQKIGCHAICPYCVVADTSGIVAGVAAVLSRGGDVEFTVRRKALFGGLAVLSMVASVGWASTRRLAPPVPERVQRLPDVIAREQRPGVATIVEFADFECPYCRRQHTAMSEVLPSYGARVRLVRRHMPLSFHVNAEPAARAACCAEEQGRLEPMADALFRSEELSASGCEHTAERIGLDMTAYRECLSSGRVTARLDHDRDDARQANVSALPTIFIGDERVEGLIDGPTLRASIDRALQRASTPQDSGAARPQG